MDSFVQFAAMLPLLIVLLVLVGGSRSSIERQTRRLTAVERKLDLIMTHLGIHEPAPSAPDAVLRELFAGRKLQAIKVYRTTTGVSLTEAKDAVELLARQHGLG